MERRLSVREVIGTWTLLFTATVIAYWPAIQGALLWDDDHHVTAPGLRSLRGLWRIWFEAGATQQYYPVLHSAFWVEHRLWGDAALGYHLVNVALHATAALLAILILRRLSLTGAALAGFVFALHPVCAEAVAWISEQKSTLSAVFCLAAALTYLDFDQSRKRRTYALASALFLLALLAKTVTATLPAALLVLLWWKRGRLRWRKDVLQLIPWLIAGLAAGIFTAWMERTYIGAQGAGFALSPAQRLLLAGRALWFYAAKLLWPADLIFTYPRWTLDSRQWQQWLYPAAALALAVALAFAARRRRGPLAAFLIFAGTLFPALGFFDVYPFRFSFVADHFQYLASMGIIAPAAFVIATGSARLISGRARLPVAGVGVALLAVLGTLTWRQSEMYRDAETLYRTTLARNADSWMAHTNLCALLLSRPGGLQDAVTHCQAALRLRPDYAEAHNDLGSAWARMPDRMADAIAEFRAALAAKPAFAEAHFNLANALAREPGLQAAAIEQYRAALRIRPDYLEAHTNLGALLLDMPGRLQEAIAEYEASLRLDPSRPEVHNNLASALARGPGRTPEAIAEYQAALAIDAHYAKAHNNLGNLLAQIPGRLADAIGEYQAAISSDPNYAEARYNLALALAKAGRTQEAIGELETVLRIHPNSASAHYNLGILLLKSGQTQEGLMQLDAALSLRNDPDWRRLVERLRAAPAK